MKVENTVKRNDTSAFDKSPSTATTTLTDLDDSCHTPLYTSNHPKNTLSLSLVLPLSLTILGMTWLLTDYSILVLLVGALFVLLHYLPNKWTQPYLDCAENKIENWQWQIKHRIGQLQTKLVKVLHDYLGWCTKDEVQILYHDLENAKLHCQETKRHMARMQEQHIAEQMENSEWHEQALQQALEDQQMEHDKNVKRLQAEHTQQLQRLTKQHAQTVLELQTTHALAVKAAQEDCAAILQDEAVACHALNQKLQEQHSLYQNERRRNEVLQQSLAPLREEVHRHAQSVRQLREDVSEQQCRQESETQEMCRNYEMALQTAKEQHQQMKLDYQDEWCRLRLQLVQQHVQRQHLERLVCQLLIVADKNSSGESWYANVGAHDLTQENEECCIKRMERNDQMLKAAVEQADNYVETLASIIQRDRFLCLPIKAERYDHEKDVDHDGADINEGCSDHHHELLMADPNTNGYHHNSLVHKSKLSSSSELWTTTTSVELPRIRMAPKKICYVSNGEEDEYAGFYSGQM